MTITWRQGAAPIIHKVLTENAGKTEKEIRKALRDAYPYGPRKMHPYKIWCDEVNKQLKTNRSKNPAAANQLKIFE